MQGDILGAAAMGVCNILCLSGDGVQSGDHPEAKPVFDMDQDFDLEGHVAASHDQLVDDGNNNMNNANNDCAEEEQMGMNVENDEEGEFYDENLENDHDIWAQFARDNAHQY